jgi:hypothetical protein
MSKALSFNDVRAPPAGVKARAETVGIGAVGGADDQQHIDAPAQVPRRRLAVLRGVADVAGVGSDNVAEAPAQCASAPEDLVLEVVERLAQIRQVVLSSVGAPEETIEFRIPAELRRPAKPR